MAAPVRVLALLPLLGHPRHAKRIAMLQKEGFLVEAVAFQRRYHQGRLPECPVTLLGSIEHGHYGQRGLRMLHALSVLRRKMKDFDLIYASGPDLGLLAHIAGAFLRKPVAIEVGDIRALQTARGPVGALARCVDRIVSRAASLLVVTTEGFAREYYGTWLKVDTPVMVIENKLEPGLPKESAAEKPAPGRALTFGYFGMLRCRRSWETLERLARLRPDIEIVVGGIVFAPDDLLERIGRLPNARWVGEYRSPGDLPALYGQVDLIWASPFPGPDEHNWRWARSNRFYESCHFGKPPIVYAGSGDGRAVRAHQIGLEVGEGGIDDDIALLSRISSADLKRWRRNIAALDPGIYTYTDESQRLREGLMALVAGKSRQAATSGA